MKRILSLTLGFAALSLIGCPPPSQPASTGTSAPASTETAAPENASDEAQAEEAPVVLDAAAETEEAGPIVE